jgi:hypothetical protein
MSLFATSIASSFSLELASFCFSLQIFVSGLSGVDLHQDCFILLSSRRFELLDGRLPLGLFGTDEVIGSITQGFLDNREPFDFTSHGFFPLVDSGGPCLLIEDGLEYSLLKSVFELLD